MSRLIRQKEIHWSWIFGLFALGFAALVAFPWLQTLLQGLIPVAT